ncbi:hypothetical protein WJX77_001682 [Trebouxia sp. C0004]
MNNAVVHLCVGLFEQDITQADSVKSCGGAVRSAALVYPQIVATSQVADGLNSLLRAHTVCFKWCLGATKHKICPPFPCRVTSKACLEWCHEANFQCISSDGLSRSLEQVLPDFKGDCWQLSSFRFLPTLASSNRGSLSSTEGACQIETKLDTENVCRLSLIINRISAKLKKGKTDKETESGPVLVLI